MKRFKLYLSLSFISLLTLLGSCGPVNQQAKIIGGSTSVEDHSANQRESAIEIYCPAIYEPVCGQPPMPICPAGQMCSQAMPTPRTYSNSCELSRSKAQLLSQGECPNEKRP